MQLPIYNITPPFNKKISINMNDAFADELADELEKCAFFEKYNLLRNFCMHLRGDERAVDVREDFERPCYGYSYFLDFCTVNVNFNFACMLADAIFDIKHKLSPQLWSFVNRLDHGIKSIQNKEFSDEAA